MTEALTALQLALLARRADDERRLLGAEPIAVVGMGLRLPSGSGQANLESPEDFWEFLLAGLESIGEVPPSRWSLDHYYVASPGTPGKIHCRHGAFLEGVDQFDPARFSISPREAQAIDPQHRLLLEVAQEALERAALGDKALRGLAAGVYLGLCTTDYAWRQLRAGLPDQALDMYFATGNSFAMAPGRLAHTLGLQGPAMAVDTACSSSLVAVDLACRSLRDRSTDLALAGGVSLLLSPVNSVCFAHSGMLAPDGHCKTFDAAADGYVRGEGCGVVVLKRLADALAAGDPVLAVLRGSGVNQDGASAGLTVPNGEAQAALLARTLQQAQLKGGQIDVLEAHGTGTPLGDPIELRALAPIYGRPERREPLRLGSVKTNLGHLEGAAGIAGLIKAVLMVQHGWIPPHLHLRQPTAQFNWQAWSLQIPTQAEPWPPSQEPRRAAVSSFGFSGTNAHVLVEQAPVDATLPAPQAAAPLAQQDWLLLSAGSEAALLQLVSRWQLWLPEQPPQAWPAICATSRLARAHLRWRLALPACSAAAALEALQRGPSIRQAAGQVPRLALELTPHSHEEHWRHWQGFGLSPSALVVPPGCEALAHALTGDPPQLRWIPAGPTAAGELQDHGYGRCLPLAEPHPDQLVQLWLEGHAIDWAPLAPQGLWPRQVLPTTPFDRVRCWPDEQPQALDPGPALEHERQWRPLGSDLSAGPVGRLLVLAGSEQLVNRLAIALEGPVLHCPSLADLDRRLDEAQDRPNVLLAAGLQTPADSLLDHAFWDAWLPLLQGLTDRAGQLGCVHWALTGEQTAIGEALAALARGWAREAGAQAGGLLWCGPQGEGLEPLLARQVGMGGGGEWRSGIAGGLEQAQVVAISAERGAGRQAPPVLPATGTTLITGGLGALGLATARELQRLGCHHFTLVARRPPGLLQRQAIAALEQAGAGVELELLDVSDGGQVDALFDRLVAAGRPLAGIIHAAGVLDDGLLSNQTPGRSAAVAAPKVLGGLHLDRCSRRLDPAFFVVYSSLAAAIGSPGQVPYGAANGFLDGLIFQRRAQGLAGLAINWGPWAGEGMAAQAPAGVERITPQEALGLLGTWLPRGGRVVLARLEAPEESHRLAAPLQAMAAALQGLAPADAQRLVEQTLAELLAELGGFAAQELDASTSLDTLGLDSLMAVELATAVQGSLRVSLGLGALAGNPTLASLASHLLVLLQHPAAAAEAPPLDLGVEAELPADLKACLAAAPAHTPSGPAEAVLVTGATGFLGAFLLADQLQRHPSMDFHCLVRADGGEAANARVRANLEHYGLWREAWASRLVGVPGDLAAPRLGLDGASWDGLARRLAGVLHSGAQLSYVAPYGQLRSANVGGTRELLRLVCAPLAEGRPAMPLEFISSTAVYEAAAYRGQNLDESQDLEEWRGIHLGYSQTKWVSERLVWHAAQAGLPVRLYRPPLIAGHSRSGAWHEQDFLHRLVRGCLALGRAPDLDMELDLVPVDYVTAAVGALAWSPPSAAGAADVVHLHHPRPLLWADLLAGLIARGAPLEAMPLEGWLRALAQQPSNPLYPLQPFFTHRWGPEQLTYLQFQQPGVRARPLCERSRLRLEALGVSCPGFDALLEPYSRTFLADLLAHG
ncbi:thioester reductase domain-containing protein [Vulcanococcus limneticus]|uniref:thioester reductase domain-containing protein n=1 Tax=Vulcanococcus limneticus TaxID=2170428 RepID=UPI00398BBEED